jgi:alginate O-acetyltransferase complex protein AlgI
MPFNSPTFLFFYLPIFLLLYFLSSGRIRLVIGVLGSLLFYSWNSSKDLPLLISILLITFFLSKGIVRWHREKYAILFLWIGILANIALLIFYKLRLGDSYPLGLSYLAFQSIACLVEANKTPTSHEDDLLIFSFYMVFFPKLILGPITRLSQVKDQIRDLVLDPNSVADGFRRFIQGLAKKVLLADTLAVIVNPVFSLPSPDVSQPIAWLVLTSYALQLFFDFSGYIDMAIGLGMMLGIKLPENFDFPYISKSISEFWRRWHITLSTWFRDFVFYPLERRRIKWIGQPLNILIVFVLTGLWHGFGLTYIIWGAIHGMALIVEGTFIGKKLRLFWQPIQHVYALLIILVGWVFFRSPTVGFAVEYLKRLAGISKNLNLYGYETIAPLPMIEPTFMLALITGLLLSVPLVGWLRERFLEKKIVGFLPFQFVYDLWIFVLFVGSVSAIAARSFIPGIYGSF